MILTKAQNGEIIKVKPGDFISIELSELGSAGYSWHINNFDSQIIELISDKTRGVSDETKVGAPVIHTWKFLAKRAGETKIKMDHYRTWEGPREASDHFQITIKIGPS